MIIFYILLITLANNDDCKDEVNLSINNNVWTQYTIIHTLKTNSIDTNLYQILLKMVHNEVQLIRTLILTLRREKI